MIYLLSLSALVIATVIREPSFAAASLVIFALDVAKDEIIRAIKERDEK